MKSNYLFTSGTTEGNINLASLLLRIFAGGFMLYQHGMPKFGKFFSGNSVEFVDFLGMGATATLALVIFSEVICALFVMLGLLTRWALIPLIITMLYAAFIAHGDDPFGKKEMSLLYLLIFGILMLVGPGKYSLDRSIQKRRKTV